VKLSVVIWMSQMPERIPFRLARMLVKAFGVSGIEVVRDNARGVIAQSEYSSTNQSSLIPITGLTDREKLGTSEPNEPSKIKLTC
jgi:hypothetical protein